MKLLTTLALLIMIASNLAYADDINWDRLVSAVFKAEGGYGATYLYGIRSIKYKDEEEARQICYNSVRNNFKRWEKAGRPDDFIAFMSRRYCPIGAENDPNGLNKHWIKNVRYFYEEV